MLAKIKLKIEYFAKILVLYFVRLKMMYCTCAEDIGKNMKKNFFFASLKV
jgi:hypothetical protein